MGADSEHLGYRVTEAADGAQALALLESRERSFDLLFTDVVMPGQPQGDELAQLAMKRWPTMKVLMTSGFPGEAQRSDGSLANLRLLSKPYRLMQLASAVRAELDSSSSENVALHAAPPRMA